MQIPRPNLQEPSAVSIRGFLLLVLLMVFSQRVDSQEILSAGMGQLGADLKWSGAQSLDHSEPEFRQPIYRLQPSINHQIFLTPNESFFPKLGLKAAGESNVPDLLNLNGGKSFGWIEGWSQGESAQWAWWSTQTGTVQFRLVMLRGPDGGKFQVAFGNQKFEVNLDPSSNNAREEIVGEFKVLQKGKQDVELTCLDGESDCKFLWIEIYGDSVTGGSVIRKRWRPSAAHTRFTTSGSDRPIRLWVMEMDAQPGTLGFYSPITTPFGYYGPTWLADGRVNTSFNFSLWSYGRGKDEPPVEQLSHLIGIGNREATFGRFGHEGTGVKVRDWEPLAGIQRQTQVFALRFEPGDQYNTYYSYYFDQSQCCWNLFGIGKQHRRAKPIDSLWVGSFVEVPGPPQVQRTGVYPRQMRYRGWVMDDDGNWFRLNQMSNGNIDRESGLTHTDRGVTRDGWFYLETGGWGYRRPNPDELITTDEHGDAEQPQFLSVESVDILKEFLPRVEIRGASVEGDDLVLEVELREESQEAALYFYYGDSEGLTFIDRWDHSLSLSKVDYNEGLVRVPNYFESTPNAGISYFRLFMKSDSGQYWSPNTWVWDSDSGKAKIRE